MSGSSSEAPLRVFFVAGEESGDLLGAALMRALRARLGGTPVFEGVGGRAMAAEGMTSLFPLSDIALAGFVSVAQALPRVFARLRTTVRGVIAAKPDVLVIIDSPDFTHRIARRVRRAAPRIPIVDYVCPSVWAWRPWRARSMRSYIDHVLALLPFEPEALQRLSGPPGTYVGHPLASQVGRLRPSAEESQRRLGEPPVLLLLPGSRRSEVERLLPPFMAAVDLVRARTGNLEVVLPTVPHLAEAVEHAIEHWTLRPRIVVSAEEKCAAFRTARAALAASGTVTLELALAGVPMVAAYKVATIEAAIARRLIRVPTVILANLVLGENVVPELLQEQCTPELLAGALTPLLANSPERQAQIDAFARLDKVMDIGGPSPEDRAADIVIDYARRAHRAAAAVVAKPRR